MPDPVPFDELELLHPHSMRNLDEMKHRFVGPIVQLETWAATAGGEAATLIAPPWCRFATA